VLGRALLLAGDYIYGRPVTDNHGMRDRPMHPAPYRSAESLLPDGLPQESVQTICIAAFRT
jgi:hypothetical protein